MLRAYQGMLYSTDVQPIFEAVESLLYLCGVHCFILEDLMDLADCFHLRIVRLCTKFDAVALFRFFLSFCQNKNQTVITYMSSLVSGLLTTDSFYNWEKFMHVH